MKKIVFFISFILSVLTYVKVFAATQFQVKNAVIEYFPKDKKMPDLIPRSKFYIGKIIIRESADYSSFKNVEVHELPIKDSKVFDKSSCRKNSELILGDLGKISLKLSKESIPSGVNGKFCHLVFIDPDRDALIKERHLLISKVHGSIFAFMIKFEKSTSSEAFISLESFVQNLRIF